MQYPYLKQMQQMGYHPMAPYGMNGFPGDIFKVIQDEAAKLLSPDTTKRLAAEALSNVTRDILKIPEVKQAGVDIAERSALEAAVSQLQARRQQLTADIQSLATSPVKFAQANPMKTVMYIGVPLAGAYFLFRMMKK